MLYDPPSLAPQPDDGKRALLMKIARLFFVNFETPDVVVPGGPLLSEDGSELLSEDGTPILAENAP